MMKKALFFAIFCALCSCNPQNLPQYVDFVPSKIIDLILPKGEEILEISGEKFTFKNRTTGESFSASKGEMLSLVIGLYDVSYSAAIKFGDDETGGIYGSKNSVEIKEGFEGFSLQTYFLPDGGDFVIEEIFFTSTVNPEKKPYNGTQYFKIFNNSDTVLYADGLAIVESAYTSTFKWDLLVDNRETDFVVWSVYCIPGNGNDVPVKPGESLLIADIAIDHKTANPWAFDLSGADFEWFDEFEDPKNTDIDNPNVKNLEKWYASTQTLWIPDTQGQRSVALVRFPDGVNKENFLANYRWTYKYRMVVNGAELIMPLNANLNSCRIPIEWIVDGVNLSIEGRKQWDLLPSSVDAGFAFISNQSNDSERYFKSVRRKVQFLNADGRRTLQDTNNSAADFNLGVVPSVVEEQGTVKDVFGNRASGQTFDGVLKK